MASEDQAVDGLKLADSGERTLLLSPAEVVNGLDFEELQMLQEAIADRLEDLVAGLNEEVERQRDQLLQAADVFAEQGRLPNLPGEKQAWADGQRLLDPPGDWLPVNLVGR